LIHDSHFVKLDDGREMVKVFINVDPESSGERLDLFLKKRLKRYSRGRIQRIINQGYMKIDGEENRKRSYRVKSGELIEILRLAPQNEQPLPHVDILFRDDSILVVDKPGNLTIHPTANVLKRTFTTWLYLNGYGDYVPAHRLDRETSGIVISAPRGEQSSLIKKEFFDKNIRKGYFALLRGRLSSVETIDYPIGEDVLSPIMIKVGVTKEGAPSSTTFVPFVSSAKGTIAGVFPHTGRQHQIRVHAEKLGFPLWGDKLYGQDSHVFLSFLNDGMTPHLLEKLGFERHMLHAAAIFIPAIPGIDARSFYSQLPDDFLSAAKSLDILLPPFVEFLDFMKQNLSMGDSLILGEN
jgi:23S rRNA pseudouridine1911/1915/1917 synthase